MKSILLYITFLISLPLCAIAAPKNSTKDQSKSETGSEEKKLPQTGTLASSTSSSYSGIAVDGPYGDDDYSGAPSTISGSVSRMGSERWMVKIFNNAEDATYSIRAQLVQSDDNSRVAKSDYISTTLKSKESFTRDFSASPSGKNASVKILSVKKIGGDKKK